MKLKRCVSFKRQHRKGALLAMLALALIATPHPPTVAAAATGLIYVNPESIPILPVKSSFNVTIKAANMDQFNGWDIEIYTEPAINATKLSAYQVTPNMLTANSTRGGIPFELARCVNGVGFGCTLTDGPGVVHSGFGDTHATSGSGLLFVVTYNVTGIGPYSPIIIQEESFSSSSPTGVSHSTLDGAYGTPDFTVFPNPRSIIVFESSSNASSIVLNSVTFAGAVNLTVVSISPNELLKVSVAPNQVRLAPHGIATVVLSAIGLAHLPAALYPVRVTAASGSVSHSSLVDVHVPADPDFALGASPGELRTKATDSNQTTIIVKSENGFAGSVNLTLQAPPGTTASLNTSKLVIPLGGEANATLSFTTQSSFIRFRDSFNVTGSSGSISHTIAVIAEPPFPDFRVTASPISATVQAGHSKVLTVGLTSLEYYAGTIYLLGTAKSGVSFSLQSSSIYLNISQTVLMTLTVDTNSTTSPGDHTITLAGLDGSLTRHEVNVTLTVLAAPQAPSQPKLVFGLQPAVYFGAIGALAVLLAILGIRELRRPKQRERRFLSD